MRHPDPERDPEPSDDDLRCACGRLLARVVDGGIELRCTRCKRALVLPWSGVEGAPELFARLRGRP
jgi:hypothetical protein